MPFTPHYLEKTTLRSFPYEASSNNVKSQEDVSMLKNKKLIGSFALSATLIGCNLSVNGVLEISSTLTFVKKTIFGSKTITVDRGRQNATVEISDKKVSLQIRDSAGKNQNVDFKVPAGNIPTDGTWIRVPAAQTGQPYDVVTSVLKQVEADNEVHRDWESCTYERCTTHCRGCGDNRDCYRECRTYRGEKRVEYRLVYTDWNIKFRLHDNAQVAKFQGERQDVTRDYLHVGPCR